MHNNDLRTELEYFREDYDEEREMKPRPGPARVITPPLRAASPRVHRRRERVVRFEETQNIGESRVERNSESRSENRQPLQSSLTSVYGGQALPNNVGGNLPPNDTFLSHNAQPFIPTNLNVPNGLMPMYVYLHQQPVSFVNGQPMGFPPQTLTGNPSIGGSFANLPQGGKVPSTFTNGNILPQNGFTYPANIPSNNYPFYTQPVYTFPNKPAYANQNSTGLFPNPLGSVTPFVLWIEDYPLPDGLKMPSHIGSYDGKGDPDNFLNLFEGAIRMQKWIPSCDDTEEKIIMNDKYPEQMVTIGKQLPQHFKKELRNLLRANADIFARTHADMTGILRTIMVYGKPFKTKHKLNEYSHIKPIKQNKQSLVPDRNAAACKEAEELMKAGIL
nr:hypothetical protein [Tanacetum cinerariifolium]